VLHRFAAAFLPLYEARKASHGWLDFDDLIQRAKALLTDPSVAAWVLYRLDGGIDHILVDEAQDTGPDQWRVIELLAAEFTASEGAEPGARTLFVVGDKKQSIYSFQGADVAAFDAKQAMFQSRFRAAGLGFQNERLEHSFRSSPAILSLVDATFAGRFPRALGAEISHIAYRDAMPGRVDLWPLVAPTDKADGGDWEDPIDLIADSHHAARLARDLAAEIGRMIRSGTMISDQGVMRRCHAGDFLILVQRRSTVFDAIIAACKREGLPIAGADRLKLGAELAVRDIAALLSFLALPEDDLSLATALRSPLFGWSEAELFDLAHQRQGFLWRALRQQAETAPETGPETAPETGPKTGPETGAIGVRTRRMLDDLRRSADFMRPYELIERLLTRWGGRARLIARLGTEAEDGIDELLSQALAYERNEVPSLTGFLTRLQTDDVDVKRQMEGEGHRIRVMTVHGSKGLEAPIVILPDTADRNPRERDELYVLADGLPVWKTSADAVPPAMAVARAARAGQTTDENLRLLYVALTRARCWLIICGAGEAKTEAAWYNLVSQGMQAVGAQRTAAARLRWQFGDWPDASAQGAPDVPDAQDTGPVLDPAALADPVPADTLPILPDWLFRPPLPAPGVSKPLSPSDLGGAKILLAPGEEEGPDAAEAMRLGSLLHLLLERLPGIARADWPAFAESVFAGEVLDEAVSVLSAPGCAAIFAPGALAEVALTAPLGAARMIGTIDRLIIRPDHVLAVDFKSNRLVPACVDQVPEGILRQMGAYGAALAAIYPGRRIELAVLWTREARLMVLPDEIVSAALRRARAA
jgi:ATP-dependent helicase/nuclease subunit A